MPPEREQPPQYTRYRAGRRLLPIGDHVISNRSVAKMTCRRQCPRPARHRERRGPRTRRAPRRDAEEGDGEQRDEAEAEMDGERIASTRPGRRGGAAG